MKHTLNTKLKISKAKLGSIPWNKGKKGLQVAWNKGIEYLAIKGTRHPMFGKKHTTESLAKMSQSCKGRVPWNKGKTGIQVAWNKGKKMIGRKHTDEAKRKIREANLGQKSHFWKGGITPINKMMRKTVEYRLWRKAVFERDNFTCQECGKRGGEIQADHIKPFALFPELRTSIDNGRTLCRPCHLKTPSFALRYDLLINK